jgi:GcrA cell cycle regulator
MMNTWPAERISELERLWATGASTAEIGRQLDVSKNAVVGKVHRLGLPGRPSPIKRESRATARAPAPQLRPEIRVPVDAPVSDAMVSPIAAPKAEVCAQAPVATATLPVADLYAPPCQWPFGNPGDEDFHFCGSPSLSGRPYCSEHCARAYVREDRRDRRGGRAARQAKQAA